MLRSFWTSHLIFLLWHWLSLDIESGCADYGRLRFVRLWVNLVLLGDLSTLNILNWISSLTLGYLHWFVLIGCGELGLIHRGCSAVCKGVLTGKSFLNQSRNFALVNCSNTWCDLRSLKGTLQINPLLLILGLLNEKLGLWSQLIGDFKIVLLGACKLIFLLV